MHETPHANPADVLERLLDGNRRFVGNARRSRDLPREVRATAGGQAPSVAIVGCIDSRAAGELVLDLGIGDAFNIRLAGNIVDAAALADARLANLDLADARLDRSRRLMTVTNDELAPVLVSNLRSLADPVVDLEFDCSREHLLGAFAEDRRQHVAELLGWKGDRVGGTL